MKYILPIFLTLCTFPMLGFAEPTISPFTKVTIYQNDISNTVTDTGIYNLCMNLQKFSLNNLGKAHLVKIQDDAVTSDHAPEYASHRRDGYAKSEIDIKNFCECLAHRGYSINGSYYQASDMCKEMHSKYAAVLMTLATFIKNDMQNIQKNTVMENCNYYDEPSVYKAALSEKDIDMLNRCSNDTQATVSCSNTRGDSRCLLTQQVKCVDGKTYTYQSCNKPVLENASNGKLAIRQAVDVCGNINDNTAVLINGTNGYSLKNDYDMNCVLKK